MTALQTDIERQLGQAEPAVEVLLAEVVRTPAHPTLRVVIDHPDGVTLGLCEQVSGLLCDLRDRYALEVSSPGSDRPLTKPDHFRAHIGSRARVRLRGDRPHPRAAQNAAAGGAAQRRERSDAVAGSREAAGRRSFTGELVSASESEVTLAAEEGVVAIPYSQIRRCNLVGE